MLGVIGLLGIALLARELYSDAVARLAIIVCLGSPYWLLMHSEYMNHALANAALVWAVFGSARAGRHGRFAWALLSGALFGVAFLVRFGPGHLPGFHQPLASATRFRSPSHGVCGRAGNRDDGRSRPPLPVRGDALFRDAHRASLRALYRRKPDRVALFVLVAVVSAPFVWSGFLANYAHAYYGVDGAAAARVARGAPPDALVFVTADYGGFVWRNDPWLKDGPIFVRDRGAKNRAVLESFPNRHPFRQVGDRLEDLPGNGREAQGAPAPGQ